MSDPIQPGLNVSWESLQTIYSEMERWYGDTRSSEQSSAPHTAAAFEKYLHLKPGQLVGVLDLLLGVRQQRNRMLRVCPFAILSAFIVHARFNFDGITSPRDAEKIIAGLVATDKLTRLFRTDVLMPQGWSLTVFTSESIRVELLCRINEFHMPYLSNESKAHMLGLRSVVKEIVGYDVIYDNRVCGGHGLHSGAMHTLQSLITNESASNTYCEVGFSWGASALIALTKSIGMQVFSWELGAGAVGAAYASAGYLKGLFGDRFHITFGDSRLTLPQGHHVLDGRLCDTVFIDGDHDVATVKEDLFNFMRISAPHTVYILDDCWHELSTGRWNDSIYDFVSVAARSRFFENDFLATDDGHCILRHAHLSD